VDVKEARRLLAEAPLPKGGKHSKIQHRTRDSGLYNTNYKEDAMVDAIDQKRLIEKYAATLEKLASKELSVDQFFQQCSPSIAGELLAMIFSESGKTKLEAIKDFLDRAGYSKVNKHAVATLDPNLPKQQLISIIEGLQNSAEMKILEDVDSDKAELVTRRRSSNTLSHCQ
jgi:hypothetical protein